MKITGLDKLQRDLKQAQEAFAAIDGRLGSVQFDPHDPSSIELAIQAAESLIDERIGRYNSNPFVGPMAVEMKENFRNAIVERAASARLEGDSSE